MLRYHISLATEFFVQRGIILSLFRKLMTKIFIKILENSSLSIKFAVVKDSLGVKN